MRDWLKNLKFFRVGLLFFNHYRLHPACSHFPCTKDSKLLERVIIAEISVDL